MGSCKAMGSGAGLALPETAASKPNAKAAPAAVYM